MPPARALTCAAAAAASLFQSYRPCQARDEGHCSITLNAGRPAAAGVKTVHQVPKPTQRGLGHA
eukprot:364289-Chlamydomonas_euryale.AAC.12